MSSAIQSALITTVVVEATVSAEKKAEDSLLLQITEQFEKLLGMVRLPSKAISTLLGWADLTRLPEQWAAFLAAQRHTIKTISSTFAIPTFIIKQVKLYQSCACLKNKLTQKTPDNQDAIVDDVKQVFFAFLSSVASGLKIPRALDKTHLIDLSKVSRRLPSLLARTECLLSLALSSMKIIDLSWTLRGQLKKENTQLTEQIKNPSPKFKKIFIKFGTSSLSIVSSSIAAASLFFGWYAHPLTVLTISTVSLVASMVSKFANSSHLFGYKNSKNPVEAATALPA